MESFKFEVRYSYFILFLQINTQRGHFQNLFFFFFPVALGYATFATNTIKQIVYSPGLQWKPIASHTGERENQVIYQKSLMPKAMGHFSTQRIIVFPFNYKFQSRHAL